MQVLVDSNRFCRIFGAGPPGGCASDASVGSIHLGCSVSRLSIPHGVGGGCQCVPRGSASPVATWVLNRSAHPHNAGKLQRRPSRDKRRPWSCTSESHQWHRIGQASHQRLFRRRTPSRWPAPKMRQNRNDVSPTAWSAGGRTSTFCRLTPKPVLHRLWYISLLYGASPT